MPHDIGMQTTCPLGPLANMHKHASHAEKDAENV